MFKSVASNTVAQLVAKFFGAGLTLLTTTLIIRISSTSVYGELTKLLVLIAIGFTIIDFGMNAVVVRRFGSGSDLRRGFLELLFSRLFFSLIVFLILNLVVGLLPGGYSQASKSFFWLGSLAVIFQGIYTSCNAVFQHHENYWRSTLSVIAGTALGAGLTLYYTFASPTLAHFLFANTAGYFLMAAVSLSLVRFPLLPFSFKLLPIFKLFSSSLPLGTTVLMSVLASKLDIILLGVMRTSAEVGEYGLAYRFFDVILVLPAFIMNAIYPRLVKGNTRQKNTLIRQTLIFMFFAGLITTAFTFALAPLILWIRPGLTLSVTSFRLLSLSFPLFFLSAPLMWYQVARRRERSTLVIYSLAALLNGVLNYFLIPSHGAPAAAIVTGLTELLILSSLVYFSRKKI